MSLSQLARALADGTRSARSTVQATLASCERANPRLAAFQALAATDALACAERLDAALAAGAEPGPLAGVPFATKANLCIAERETNCGSALLAGYRPPYTATAVERLVAAGAIPIGTTNMDEFGMGSSGENTCYGIARNPWDLGRTPGGSSSGSAVSVAAGLVPFALGSDTGGSVRQPAALSGVFGLKPSYGAVSRYGLVAFASSLDVVGVLAAEATDLATLLAVLAGPDPLDATTVRIEGPGNEADRELDGLVVGVARETFGPGLDPRVEARTNEALAALERAGCVLREVSLPLAGQAVPIYYVIATGEASSNLARYDGVRYGRRVQGDDPSLDAMFEATRAAGFGDEVKRRILLGTYVLSAGYAQHWYTKALRARRRLVHEFDAAFREVDVLLGPTTPTPAFHLGERVDDPLAMYACDHLTVPASLAGLPAVSAPVGTVDDPAGGATLPVGLQWVGPRGSDARLCALVAAADRLGAPFTSALAPEVSA